jgi:hypothetical protein
MNNIGVLHDFPLVSLRFTLHVTQRIALPTYKGSTFHGGFGHALARIGPRFRDYFFAASSVSGVTGQQALPKPFMLIPPLAEQTDYSPGDSIQFDLILFGHAMSHFMIAFAAIECLGSNLGIGRNSGRFRIATIEQHTLEGPQTLFADDDWAGFPKPIFSRQILDAGRIDAHEIVLSLLTRLRLKHDNALVHNAPIFAIFFDRLLGRINSLSALYGKGMLVPPTEKHRLLALAKNVELAHSASNVCWVDWERPQKAGKDAMSFGGLLGAMRYTGKLAPFMPWLTLGQWTGIGGKTSFGLGKYHMEVRT